MIFFLSKSYLSNYADDNNLYNIGKDRDIVKELLKKDFRVVTEWFYENYMILNPQKCHYMSIGNNAENDKFEFEDLCLENSEEEVILGITIDNKLSFDSHIKKICRNIGQKLSVLLRIASYLELDQKKLLFNAMIKSQFSYCPLVCMFSSRKSNNLINKIHERTLRIISNDNKSSFEQLLINDNDMTIHQRNLQVLMTEVYKIVNGYAPPIMQNLFLFRENVHNIRNFQDIANENKHTVRYGLETVSYRTPLLWAKLPDEFKLATSLSEFKSKIKSWKCDVCTCRLCQTFHKNIGFI